VNRVLSERRFILIGPPGAGKTTVGRYLARELGLTLIDTDQAIEEESNRTISEIFTEEGETYFRELEKRIVKRELRSAGAVIALGGGAVMDPEIEDLLQNEKDVIYLAVSIANAAPRVGFNRERPLLLGNPRQQWLSLMKERKAIYDRLAKITVSTDNRKPAEVVEEIKEMIL
jgi:shikimate kinase